MEFVRYFWVAGRKNLLLHRLVSSRITQHRCFSNTTNFNTPSNSTKTEVFKNCIFCTQRTSPSSCRLSPGWRKTDGVCGKRQILLNNPVRHSGSLSRLPQTGTVARNLNLSAHGFHTSTRLNVLLPPHLWLLIKPIQKLFAIILGRSVRKWWKALPANKRQLFKESLWRNRWKVWLGVTGVGLAFIIFWFTNLEEAPITGRIRLLMFKKEHYDLLTSGAQQSSNIRLIEEFQDKMLPKEDERYQLVQKTLRHLIARNSDLPEVAKIEWTVHVVDKPVINAMVLPNGQVFVFTGMLDATGNDDQLTFILGHELAHAILDHMVEKASVSHFLDFLFLISLAMIWAVCPMDSLAVVGQWIQNRLREFMFERPFSRTLEAEADKVGLQLAAKACADVRGSSVFWKQMDLVNTIEGNPSLPEWISTHPSNERRAEHLERLIPKALKLRESCDCPALPYPDPRLVFEMTKKHLLKASREQDDKAIKGVLPPVSVDDSALLTTAIRAT